MARIIEGGLDAFRALAYDAVDSRFVERLRERNNSYDDCLIGRARDMIRDVRNRYESFDLDKTKRLLKASMRKISVSWNEYEGLDLRTIAEFQHASERQRRFIMSAPSVRELYYKNRIEGYGDKYKDPYPNRVGEQDPIYRIVMNGMWQEDDEGMYFTEYWEDDEMALEEPIDADEQFEVMATWDRIKNILDKMDDDPTSPFNNKM